MGDITLKFTSILMKNHVRLHTFFSKSQTQLDLGASTVSLAFLSFWFVPLDYINWHV